MSKELKTLDEAVGAELRRVRREKEMSQADLGSSDDVSFQQVQKYESGRNSMRLPTFVRFCRKLGLDPRIVLGRALGQAEK